MDIEKNNLGFIKKNNIMKKNKTYHNNLSPESASSWPIGEIESR